MKYQKLFKTLNRSRFQGMYWCAHKTATLTSIQHTVPPQYLSSLEPPLQKNLHPQIQISNACLDTYLIHQI